MARALLIARSYAGLVQVHIVSLRSFVLSFSRLSSPTHFSSTSISRLTDLTSNNYSAAWSPDGRWITFASNRQGKVPRDLYRKPSNSAGSEELLLESTEDKSPQD